ncbi:TonB-dependent receptor [Chitinophaga qingshengii]|uniref:TonB-dependent receptor n=1 Tax=Chitinophaga qingshengii TaxID=1569794 RepID=A0ABR7TFQ8_9BACT|nr:TonB-dependent receptor [Chitinophaga qingshengii]MBC9929197.1 TonB-dependent receptor [Chitinophaga qingshengii]
MILNLLHKGGRASYCRPSKIFVVMRIATTLLLTAFISFSAAANAQKVNLSEKNASLVTVIHKLRSQTGYNFFYVKDHINTAKPVNVNLTDVPLAEALKIIFEDQPLSYVIDGKEVTVRKKAVTAPVNPLTDVTGKILDSDGTPLPFVSIVVKGTQKGAITKADGSFSLSLNKGDVILVRSIGFETQEITYTGQTSLDIRLKKATNSLSDVVVIGYGAVKQKNLTGAVTSVKGKDLDITASSNFQSALQGKASGVQVVQTTGQPGAGIKVQIRSNPSFANAGVLYVIDGVPIMDAATPPVSGSKYGVNDQGGVDKSPLNFINPNDIASIEFLKDASAASIYGARAGAGVVLITTKKGTSGKPKVEYTGSYGFQNVDKMYPVYGAADYMKQRNLFNEELWVRKNKVAPYYGTVDRATVTDPLIPIYSQRQIDSAYSNTEKATDAITRGGYTQQHNVAVSGGNGKTTYYASGNYYDQKGVIIGTDFKRYNGRLSLDQVISDKIKIGGSMILSNSAAHNTFTGGANENGGIITSAIYWAPVQPLQLPDGSYPTSPYYPSIPNPLSYGTITDLTKNTRVLTSAYGEWTIIPELKANVRFSYDNANTKRSTYLPRTFSFGNQVNGSANIAQSDATSSLLEYTLAYNKTFSEKHNLSAVAGYSYQKSGSENLVAGNQGFLSDISQYYNLNGGQAAKPLVGSGKAETVWASYFARAIYTYRGNITLQASIRRDGSSVFAPNKKWGYFPGVSAGWVLSDEAFLKGFTPLSFLKIRAGYGETGNSAFGAAANEVYSSALSPYFGAGNVNSGLIMTRSANPNLTWETAGELNAGIDFGFFNNRLSGSVDYFRKDIRNLIAYVRNPTGFILDSSITNAGQTRSTGYEISLHSKNIVTKNFSWSTSVNFSHYLNYWVKRSPAAMAVLPRYENATGGGALFNPIFGYIATGFYKGDKGSAPAHMPGMLPGGLILEDIHGYDSNGNLTSPDGTITDADKTYLANGDPRFNFGIGNQFTYKNFDLSIFFSGLVQKKWSPYLSGRINEAVTGQFGFNAMPVSSDRWSFQNPNGNFPTALTDGSYSRYQNASSYWLADASFLRCRNITLGYALPEKVLEKQKVFSGVRFSFDVQNPFTITKYPGLDPELNPDNFYPLVKSYVFGVNVSF